MITLSTMITLSIVIKLSTVITLQHRCELQRYWLFKPTSFSGNSRSCGKKVHYRVKYTDDYTRRTGLSSFSPLPLYYMLYDCDSLSLTQLSVDLLRNMKKNIFVFPWSTAV